MKLFPILLAGCRADFESVVFVNGVTSISKEFPSDIIDISSEDTFRPYEHFLIDSLQNIDPRISDLKLYAVAEMTDAEHPYSAVFQVIYDNSDESLNELIHINSSIMDYFDNVAFDQEDFYAATFSQHDIHLKSTQAILTNHGTCRNGAGECKRVTIDSEVCYSRDDITSETPNSAIQNDYAALDIFNGKKGFINSGIVVDDVTANGDTLEITHSKGEEGVSDVWFRFSFSDSGMNGAYDVCGTVTTVWDEVPRKEIKTDQEWMDRVTRFHNETLVDFIVKDQEIERDFLCVAMGTCVPNSDGLSEQYCQTEGRVKYNLKAKKARTRRRGENSYLLSVNVGQVSEKKKYSGLLAYGVKACGEDFINKLESGEITIDPLDNEATYEMGYQYLGQKDHHKNIVFQYTADGKTCKKCMGNKKKDVLELFIRGFENVDWGNKDPEHCILSIRNGYAGKLGKAQFVEDDITGCVSWTNTYGAARYTKKQIKRRMKILQS